MPSDIILIGPVRTGKSTVGKLLAGKLNVPQVSLDELRLPYYQEIGYDETLARTIHARGGFLALVLYWQLFDVYSVERVLADHRNCVFDFGAGVDVYESRELYNRIQQALQPYPHVFLLLPQAAMESALLHKQKVTASIDRIVKLARVEGDYDTDSLLQWFVDEQVEEEEVVDDVLQKLRLIGDFKPGLYLLDGEWQGWMQAVLHLHRLPNLQMVASGLALRGLLCLHHIRQAMLLAGFIK